MSRGLLVAQIDHTDALVPAALVDRHHVATGEREHDVDARGGDRAGRQPTPLQRLTHRRRL